jgi:cold shock CspA family protein
METQTVDAPVLIEKDTEPCVGTFTGQCKWFNDRYGYGFITVTTGEKKGVDIFVHHTGIRPLNSIYRTLRKGEYVNFNIVMGENGDQAVDVTGIGGGTLMCDVLPPPRAFVFEEATHEMLPPSTPMVYTGRGGARGTRGTRGNGFGRGCGVAAGRTSYY